MKRSATKSFIEHAAVAGLLYIPFWGMASAWIGGPWNLAGIALVLIGAGLMLWQGCKGVTAYRAFLVRQAQKAEADRKAQEYREYMHETYGKM